MLIHCATRLVKEALENAVVLDAPEQKVRNQVFNVGTTKENYRKQDIVDAILKHLPDTEIEYVQKDEDPRDYRVDFSRIHDVLGFDSAVTVDHGVREVIRLISDRVITDPGHARYRN